MLKCITGKEQPVTLPPRDTFDIQLFSSGRALASCVQGFSAFFFLQYLLPSTGLVHARQGLYH